MAGQGMVGSTGPALGRPHLAQRPAGFQALGEIPPTVKDGTPVVRGRASPFVQSTLGGHWDRVARVPAGPAVDRSHAAVWI